MLGESARSFEHLIFLESLLLRSCPMEVNFIPYLPQDLRSASLSYLSLSKSVFFFFSLSLSPMAVGGVADMRV